MPYAPKWEQQEDRERERERELTISISSIYSTIEDDCAVIQSHIVLQQDVVSFELL
jgi:hypothetical protein